jgi:hypothetical protein
MKLLMRTAANRITPRKVEVQSEFQSENGIPM